MPALQADGGHPRFAATAQWWRVSPTAIAATPSRIRIPPSTRLAGSASPSHKVDAARPQAGTARYDSDTVVDGNARWTLTAAQNAKALASDPLYSSMAINHHDHSARNGPAIAQATKQAGTISSAIWYGASCKGDRCQRW